MCQTFRKCNDNENENFDTWVVDLKMLHEGINGLFKAQVECKTRVTPKINKQWFQAVHFTINPSSRTHRGGWETSASNNAFKPTLSA